MKRSLLNFIKIIKKPPNEWNYMNGSDFMEFKIKEARVEYNITQKELSEIT